MDRDGGTTLDGGREQTQETMPDAEGNAVPKPLSETEGADGTPSLSAERKEEIRQESRRKLNFVERQFWLLRQRQQKFMDCPYCGGRNLPDTELCCETFSHAFAAILDRQDQIDAYEQMMSGGQVH